MKNTIQFEGTDNVQQYPNKVDCKPMVSVCVMTYQHEDFISKCLESIIMQKTKFEFEILLGEDHSSDGTREICIDYAKRFPDKIKLFLHNRTNVIFIDGKPSGRYNFLYNLLNAQGRYIALCEGDDYWTDPLKLQKQVDFLEINSDYVLTCHDYQNFFYSDSKYGPIIKGKPMTLTLLFRNVIRKFPDEMSETANGDTFLRAMLRDHGKFYYMDTIDPSIRGVHKGGAVSTLDEISLWPRRIKTHEALLKYYKGEKKEIFYREKVARFKIKYNSLLLKNASFSRKIELLKESINEAFRGYSILYFIKVMIFNKG